MNKSRITYRFDHNGQAISTQDNQDIQTAPEPREDTDANIIPLHTSEYKVVTETQQLNQYTTDFGDWNSPFDTEVSRLEKLIKQSSHPDLQELNASSGSPDMQRVPTAKIHEKAQWQRDFDAESKQEKRDWYYELQTLDQLDQAEQHRYGPIIDDVPERTRYLRRPRPPWTKIIASVSGAIITGVLLGWFVLSLFSNDGSDTIHGTERLVGGGSTMDQNEGNWNDSANPPIVDDKLPVVNSDEDGDGDVPAVMEQEGVLRVDLPARTFVVIQHGVFSSIEGVREAQNMLQSKGYSGVSELKDHYYVYAALTMSHDDAILLKYRMEQAEVEAFVKDYSLPAVSAVKWNGKATTAVKEYVAKGNELVEVISRLSVLQLGKEQLTAFEAASLTSVRDLHREWTSVSGEMTEGLGEQAKDMLQRMNNALDSAVVSIEEFNKNPSSAHLWQAQAGITQFILLQRGLLADIEAE